jgi:hypothetical protein
MKHELFWVKAGLINFAYEWLEILCDGRSQFWDDRINASRLFSSGVCERCFMRRQLLIPFFVRRLAWRSLQTSYIWKYHFEPFLRI